MQRGAILSVRNIVDHEMAIFSIFRLDVFNIADKIQELQNIDVLLFQVHRLHPPHSGSGR